MENFFFFPVDVSPHNFGRRINEMNVGAICTRKIICETLIISGHTDACMYRNVNFFSYQSWEQCVQGGRWLIKSKGSLIFGWYIFLIRKKE